jgi:CheY-like chemotaxis protein
MEPVWSNQPKKMILLIEDNSDDAFLIERALEKANGAAKWKRISDGQEAREYLQGEGPFSNRLEHPHPSLVLLDWKLAGQSGHSLLDWIRSQPGIRRVPVVVFSSSDNRADIEKAYEAGANSFIMKPVGAENLRRVIFEIQHYWITINVQPDHYAAE